MTYLPGQRVMVGPASLKPARPSLDLPRVQQQRQLARHQQARFTPIQINAEGVIVDGHHAVRAAAEDGRMIEVLVVDFPLKAVAQTILDLPVE